MSFLHRRAVGWCLGFNPTLLVVLILCLGEGRLASAADFSGTPVTFQVDGGWCWFQDPRAIIVNGHLVFGTTAGTTVNNVSTGGDEKATDYNFGTGAASTFALNTAYNQDDHASPAFAVLPDGRILATYNNHGGSNYVLWRVSTYVGDGTSWGPEQTSTVNIVNDGNGNSYENPWYLSVPNTVFNFSRAIGYDTNYSKFIGLSSTNNSGMTNAGNFVYGGHFQYWKNPGTGTLTGGNGRPYVKYTSNGTDKIWFATTEDSPQNYVNSLYAGYVQFNSTGVGTVYTSTGTSLGLISTGTNPSGSNNPPASGGNQGPIASGSGYSYQPTQFTPIAKANDVVNGFDLSSSSSYGAGYAAWGSSMCLDGSGNPYLGFVVARNTDGSYGNNLEYGYAHLSGTSWKVSRVGYAGYALYSSQNQYAGLIAVDPSDYNKVYFSANVDPQTKADLLGPDGKRHWQIFKGVSADGGSTWAFTQLTNTSSDNVRPVIAAGSGREVLLWMQGTYTSYTNYNTNIVGLTQPLAGPVISVTTPSSNSTILSGTDTKLHVSASITETGFSGSFTTQWSTVSGPANAIFANSTSVDTTAQFPKAGTYLLQITAGDGAQTASANLTVTVNSTVNTAPTNSLALWLKLDESSGTTAADSSGLGLTGTLAGGTAWQPTDGNSGGAVQLDGTNGYLSLPANVVQSLSNFTISTWVKVNKFSTWARIFDFGTGTSNYMFLVPQYTATAPNAGKFRYGIRTASVTEQVINSSANIGAGTWNHVAVTLSGSTGTIYVNGIASGTNAAMTLKPSSLGNSTLNYIGKSQFSVDPYFSGAVDDFRIYSRALSASEIAAIANSPFNAPGVSCGSTPSATSLTAAKLNGTVSDNGGSTATVTWTKVSGTGTVAFDNAQNAVTNAMFSQAGTYVLRLSASNTAGETADELTVTVSPNPNVYADWIKSAYPNATDGSIIGAEADPDHDGVSNLMEWALDLNPAKGDAAPWTSGHPGTPVQTWRTVNGLDYLSIEVRRPIGRTNITYSAEVSSNLQDWTSAVQVGAAVSNGDGSETVVFRDTVPKSQAAKRFIHLRVTQP